MRLRYEVIERMPMLGCRGPRTAYFMLRDPNAGLHDAFLVWRLDLSTNRSVVIGRELPRREARRLVGRHIALQVAHPARAPLA